MPLHDGQPKSPAITIKSINLLGMNIAMKLPHPLSKKRSVATKT